MGDARARESRGANQIRSYSLVPRCELEEKRAGSVISSLECWAGRMQGVEPRRRSMI